MRIHLIVLSLLFMLGSSMAKAHKDPIRWGKILASDTSLNVYQKNPNAPAIVLCDYGTTEVGPRTEYTRLLRIKILKNEGLGYARVEIPYRDDERYDVITQLKAHTINVNGKGKLDFTRVKNRDIEDVAVDRWNRKKVFTFRDVKPGSIIEYKYTIRSLDLVKLRDWYFQTTIPTLWSEYRIYINPRFDYLVTFQKGRALEPDEQKAFAEKLQWLYDTRVKKVRRDLIQKKFLLFDSKTAKVYYGQGESFRFTMNDVPALKPDEKMVTFKDYFPVIKAHLYYADGFFPFYYRRILATAREDYDWSNPHAAYYHYFRGFIAYWLPTWDEAVQSWLSSDLFGERLKKGADAESVLDMVKDPNGDKTNNVRNIYTYVRENIKWDGTYSMFAYRNLKTVLKRKSGSSGEINLLLISMLRQAGIDAEPVLIRTLDQGRPENVYPSFGQFNHVIARVEADGKIMYLDASGNSTFNKLPWNVDHADGFLVKKNDYKWVEVEPQSTQKVNFSEV